MVKLDQIETKLVYRALGNRSPNHRLGVGFMHKRANGSDGTSDHYSLVYLLRGNGVYKDSEGEKPLSAGSIFQRIPGHSHTSIAGENWLECFLALPTVMFESLLALGLVPATPNVCNIGVNMILVNQFQELMRALQDAPEHMLPTMLGKIITLLNDTLAGAYDDRDTQMVETACRLLGSDLASRVNIPELCSAHGWGYERFRKVFQDQIGLSPGQYRIRRRIDAACELLHNRDLSIAHVAEALGYPSAFEFSGQFKKQTGLPPSHYRRRG